MQEKNIPPSNFAANLRNALNVAGLTQAQLAERTGCTQPDISRYLSVGRLPSGDKLVGIALALGTTAEALIQGRAIAYNSLDGDDIGPPVRFAAGRKGGNKRVLRLVTRAEDALKALREELAGV